MNYEEYRKQWLIDHPLVPALRDKKDYYDELHEPTIKLAWLKYCNKHSISLDKGFCDKLYEDLIQAWREKACRSNEMDLSSLGRLFSAVGYENACAYDDKLLDSCRDLLRNVVEDHEKFRQLFLSWADARPGFLSSLNLGYSSSEASMMVTYQDFRDRFIEIRDKDFVSMWKTAIYFCGIYEDCKEMDRRMMAGDIVKINNQLLLFMRDVLASAKGNGYYDYEDRIREEIEELKAETDSAPSVFISYSWDEKDIVDRIERAIALSAKIKRDSNEIETGERISAFMKTIREQDFVILVVSEGYLKSRNCMYELLQLMKDYEEKGEDLWNKVMPLVITGKAFAAVGRAEIISFWDDNHRNLEASISKISASASEELAREAKVFNYIKMEIGRFLEYLNDHLSERDPDKFIEHVKERLGKWGRYGGDPFSDCIKAAFETGDL